MSSTTTQYQPRDFRRVCDQCGVLYNRSRLHRHGPWIYCDTCDEPGDRIREELDAAVARQPPFRILPVPNSKPQNYHQPYDWLLEDAQIFNLVLATAPARTPNGASDPAAAAWGAAYLAGIVSRGTRPPVWLSTAAVKLRSLCSTLLGLQYGSPTGPAAAVTDPRYGGFLVSGTYATATVAAAGLAFVQAAAALGDSTLLVAADRCATFLRHAQSGNIQTSSWTVFPSGGATYYVGGVAQAVTDSTGLQVATYTIDDAGAALWFLTALEAARGTSATYGDASSTSTFSAATKATLAVMIADLTTFLATGPQDSGAGTTVAGLSPTKPQASYSAAVHGGGGSAAWTFASSIAGASVALGILGVFLASGVTSQVTAMMAWLAGLTANPANATPTTNTPQQTLDGITGTYSPATAPPTLATTSAPFTEATGALYDLAVLGILAPVLNATNVAALRSSRSIVSPIELYSVNLADGRFPGPLGRAGLSLQPHSSATTTVQDVVYAAQFAAVYAYANP